MTTRTAPSKSISGRRSASKRSKASLCARDRLLAALESSPRLRREEAERINHVVQEAREASVATDYLIDTTIATALANGDANTWARLRGLDAEDEI